MMTNQNNTMLAVLAAFALVAMGLAGCLGSEEQEEGTLAMYVKDAPSDDYDEVWVEFSTVMVHKAGNGSGNGSDNESGNWITVFDDANGTQVDLKNFTGDTRAFLGTEDLETGQYTQIRISVSSAWGVDAEGERTDFTVPSGELRIVKPWTIQANQTTAITVDYDLDQSIQPAGPTGKVIFKPVLGQVVVEDDAQQPPETAEPGDPGPTMAAE